MCFYCDCKRAVVDTTDAVFLGTPDTKTKPSTNGTRKRKKSGTPRLGNT
ncbi:MAG: hypothetical protein M3O21_00860 [Chloroflexota bacterium]|nr:hypothetical protein [Chloroflexota bacterium]